MDGTNEQSFDSRLTARGPGGAWVFLPVPFDVEQVFGFRARVPVSGTVNGAPFRNSLLPEGDGTHAMAFGKDLQAAAGAKAGDTVHVILRLDTEPRVTEVPPDLQAALDPHPEAAEFFATLAPSHKKEYVVWIDSAKKPETRTARIAKAVAMLQAKTRRLR
jgi:hypothetical protein